MESAVTQIQFDSSQQEVVTAEAASRHIVIAGPGAGKTSVVIGRIDHLISVEDVDAYEALLVVSFSNAAVNAVKSRLTDYGHDLVAVQTLDSFATELLRDISDEDYESLSFDQRITRARELLVEEGWERVEWIEHLIVDEIQDVVGVRADFLLTIIDSLQSTAGFTLLGDPAQGIYDFQIHRSHDGKPAHSSTSANDLLTRIMVDDRVTVLELTGQYRARSRDAKEAMQLRSSVLPDGDPSKLAHFYNALIPVGTIKDAAEHAQHWDGTTAFLTYTNGQALLVASKLREYGYQVEVRRRAQQRVIASWVGKVFAECSTDTITHAELGKLLELNAPQLDRDSTWKALRVATSARGREVNLRTLERYLRSPGALQPEFLAVPKTRMIVSTIHRAKGLEFDNVVLVDFPGVGIWPTEDDSEQLRVRFVALSRAADLIVRADGPEASAIRLFKDPERSISRWYRSDYREWPTLGFEIRAEDVEPLIRSAPQLHQYLAHELEPGDLVDFRLDTRESTLRIPRYLLSCRQVDLARTTLQFGIEFAQRIGNLEGKRKAWPNLSGGRVETVATYVADPMLVGDGRCLFLVPIITGMLTVEWKDT